MSVRVMFTALLVLILTASFAYAVSSSKTIVFDESPMGKVTFSGKVHSGQGMDCKDCHRANLFPKMKKGTVKINMTEIKAGRLCGSCHDGKVAFGVDGNCTRCHKR